MSPDDIRQQIELAVVERIKLLLSDGKITEERAQQISQLVLNTLKPGMSLEDLYRGIPKLDDICQELSPVIVPYLRQYEEDVNQKAMGEMQRLIKVGEYDAAATLGKNVINQDIQLEWHGEGKADGASNNESRITNNDKGIGNPASPAGGRESKIENTNSGIGNLSNNRQPITDNSLPLDSDAPDGASAAARGVTNTNDDSRITNNDAGVGKTSPSNAAPSDNLNTAPSNAAIATNPSSKTPEDHPPVGGSKLATADNSLSDNRQPTTDHLSSVLPDQLDDAKRDNIMASMTTPVPTIATQMIPPDDLLPDPFGTTPLR